MCGILIAQSSSLLLSYAPLPLGMIFDPKAEENPAYGESILSYMLAQLVVREEFNMTDLFHWLLLILLMIDSSTLII